MREGEEPAAAQTADDDPGGADHDDVPTAPSEHDVAAFDPEAGGLPRPHIAASALRAATVGAARHGDVSPDDGATTWDDATADCGVDEPGSADTDGASRTAAGEGSPPGTDAGTDATTVRDEDEHAWRVLPLTTRLEALLFAAVAPLTFRRLQALAGDVDTDALRGALGSLEAHYRATSRAFGLEEIGGGFQLRTRPELSGLLARLGRRHTAEKLSPAALETLAIVAYRQPVLRVDVERIRGVASGEVLRTLVEKGLVRVAGRADLPGAPLLYGTTPSFLELFGLRDLRDLPSDRELLRAP